MKYTLEETEQAVFKIVWGKDLREREDAEAFAKEITQLFSNTFKIKFGG